MDLFSIQAAPPDPTNTSPEAPPTGPSSSLQPTPEQIAAARAWTLALMRPPTPDEPEPSQPTEREVMPQSDDAGGAVPPPSTTTRSGTYIPAPTIEVATQALADIKLILRPPRDSGAGYKDPKLPETRRTRLEKMRMFLWTYVDSKGGQGWMAASAETARAYEGGPWLAGRLRKWTRAFIADGTLP